MLWLLLISTPFLPDLVVGYLEDKYMPVANTDIENIQVPVNILVLGGGHTDDLRLPFNSQLSESTLARLTEGIRLHQRLNNSKLITSGYGRTNQLSDARVSANTAILLGIESSRIKMQETPENTRQEASSYKQIFGDSAKLILVTSAAHMPRAIYLFNKVGLAPIAAPTNYLVKKEGKSSSFHWIPSSCNIEKMESAMHEYFGLIWYKLGGE